MTILNKTLVWGKNEYQWAREYWDLAQSVFWIHTEVPLAADIHDWKMNLTDLDRHVVGSILKTFTQAELHIGEYWSSKVAVWFPKPEIQQMAICFGNFETIHARGYAALNEALNLEHEFEAFLEVPEFSSKIERLLNPPTNPTLEQIATSLAIFSGFTEGVSLFSSFSALDSFRTRGLMKGMSRIIEWSIRDEVIHAEAGCKLFNVLCEDYPQLRNTIAIDVYEAAKTTVAIEEGCLDQIFKLGNLPNLNKDTIFNYINYRANIQLQALGYNSVFPVDENKLILMQDFNSLTTGLKHTDFFVNRPSDYKKWEVSTEKLWAD